MYQGMPWPISEFMGQNHEFANPKFAVRFSIHKLWLRTMLLESKAHLPDKLEVLEHAEANPYPSPKP